MWKMNELIRWILGFLKSGSLIFLIMSHATEIVVTKNLPFLKFKLKNHLMYFVNLYICCSFVFSVSKHKGMTTKKPEEGTYFVAGNSSRIREKIQIQFEINNFCITDW